MTLLTQLAESLGRGIGSAFPPPPRAGPHPATAVLHAEVRQEVDLFQSDIRRWDDRAGLLLGVLAGLSGTYIANQLAQAPRLPGWLRAAAGAFLVTVILVVVVVHFIGWQRRVL